MKTKKIKCSLVGMSMLLTLKIWIVWHWRSIWTRIILSALQWHCLAEISQIDGELDGVKLIKCRNPHRIWKYISYLHGIMWCDVAYLPKREVWEFCAKCLKWFGKKSFTTVEGVIDGTNLDKAIIVTGSREAIVKSCHFTNITYAITKFMAGKE